MIRPEVMDAFADLFRASGFRAASYLPSYGLAEATLAVSIMPPGEGIFVDLVDEKLLAGEATATLAGSGRCRPVVNCGKPIPGTQVEIRNEAGQALDERGIGKIWCRGPSVMLGYFRDEEATRACLDDAGWLDTGDVGYMAGGYLYVVGRAKDVIIVHGRNFWPQDLEWIVEQMPSFRGGDAAAFSVTNDAGEEQPAILVQWRGAAPELRAQVQQEIAEQLRNATGLSCVVELVPPRALPRTTSGKLSRARARELFIRGAWRKSAGAPHTR